MSGQNIPARFQSWKWNYQQYPKRGSSEEKIKFFLGAGILAPSTHNSQPWLFKIGNNYCDIYANPQIRLVEADPYKMCLFISLGCCIENIVIAVSYYNKFKRVINKINSRDNLIARIEFKNLDYDNKTDNKYKYLAQAIPKRINARGFFYRKPINQNILKKLTLKYATDDIDIAFIGDKAKINQIAKLTAYAVSKIYAKREFRFELSNWINHNLSKKRQGLPGYALKMPTLISIMFPILNRYINLSRPISLANYKSINSMSLACLISSKDRSYQSALSVGRSLEGILLDMTASNIKTSIFLASLEWPETKTKIKSLFRTKYIPQLLFCAGYTDGTLQHTPRHLLNDKIIL